ncbi:beta-lactamase [Starkeya koreensis]|uniref:Beta-lactamase n=1 Tax=Ancylobacter koreensis TaxID=266121 RepID=A0ABT0DIZ9_9HYPH|nr:class C beta-lactamase [Ancylobacter koreensis]MCK0207256.1 beta-lactamase [Ancylobacter koreensis]
MTRLSRRALLAGALLPLGAAALRPAPARAAEDAELERLAGPLLRALMKANDIPGLVLGVTREGRHATVSLGVTARQQGRPVEADTLFELGSVSKTFAAALATLAALRGKLDLSGPLGTALPEVAGTPFGALTPIDLATHSTGGMPLQLPEGIGSEEALFGWLREWRPPAPPQTRRAYSNVSIGVLGLIAARAFGTSFARAAEAELFAPLGLKSTFIEVPAGAKARYAMGYNKANAPVRVTPALLEPEAYGVKSTAADMLTFLDAQLGAATVPAELARALAATHTGYVETANYVQEMIWERYPWPVGLDRLLAGNSLDMALKPQPARRLDPPLAPVADSFVNKTGSTSGFGAYAVMLPAKRLGIVLLANRNYPNGERVKTVYALLDKLAAG